MPLSVKRFIIIRNNRSCLLTGNGDLGLVKELFVLALLTEQIAPLNFRLEQVEFALLGNIRSKLRTPSSLDVEFFIIQQPQLNSTFHVRLTQLISLILNTKTLHLLLDFRHSSPESISPLHLDWTLVSMLLHLLSRLK